MAVTVPLRHGRKRAPSACTWAQHAVNYGAARWDTRAPSHLALVHRTVAHALSVSPAVAHSFRAHALHTYTYLSATPPWPEPFRRMNGRPHNRDLTCLTALPPGRGHPPLPCWCDRSDRRQPALRCGAVRCTAEWNGIAHCRCCAVIRLS
jgi:hypothetical protein